MLFKVLLSVLGRMMTVAVRRSPAFRRQCTRDLVVQIGSDDGVAHHFIFGRRTLAAGPGPVERPDLAVTFATANLGFLALSSPRAVHKVAQAMLAGKARVDGNPVLLLWFFGLTRIVVPLNRQRPLRQPLPDGFVAHDRASSVHDRITRLPAVQKIDPAWTGGVTRNSQAAPALTR